MNVPAHLQRQNLIVPILKWPIDQIAELKFLRNQSIYRLRAPIEDTGATNPQQVIIGDKTMPAPKTIRLYDEISILNQIINDDSQIHKLRQCIDPYSVSIKRHRILRQAIAQLYDLQHPIDLVNLSWYLADHALLDEVGGFRYLQYIAGFHHSTGPVSSRNLPPPDQVETAS